MSAIYVWNAHVITKTEIQTTKENNQKTQNMWFTKKFKKIKEENKSYDSSPLPLFLEFDGSQLTGPLVESLPQLCVQSNRSHYKKVFYF